MARCEAWRQGAVVGTYDPTRGAIVVPVSQSRIDIFCSAEGFKDKRVSVGPDHGGRGAWAYVLLDFGVYEPSYPASLSIELEPADRPGEPA
jgi:hypothetical protein